jgi:hypothetical protein
MPARDAYEFEVKFVPNVIQALSGEITLVPIPVEDPTQERNGTRPHKVRVLTEVNLAETGPSIGPFTLGKETQARILVTADYRRAKNGQPYESPFCDGDHIDIPHFAKDFKFCEADQKCEDWSKFDGKYISWTLDFEETEGATPRADYRGDLYGLTVTVRARFKDADKFYSVHLPR